MREEEVFAGVLQFLRRRISCVTREKDLPGRDPPAVVAFAVNVAGLVLEHRVAHAAAVDLSDQAWREGKLVAFEGQRQRLQFAQRQRTSQVVAAVERAQVLDQAPLLPCRARILLVRN
jgi:hypothetical protein